MTISATGLSWVSRRTPIANDIIKASWRRCISEYRLDPADRNGVTNVSSQAFKVLHGEISELLADTAAIIEQIRKVARDAGSVFIVSNANGIIVRRHADSPSSQDILQNGFALGSILHEQQAGTNGIGTCIISRQPITVHADAHFNESFRGFTCSAAPVFGSNGNVLAAVDISGRPDRDGDVGVFARHFIRDAAQHMSLFLFRKKHRNDCIINISQSEEAAPLPTNAFIATDEAGRILGATAGGFASLGVADLQSLAGRTLRDFCSANIIELNPVRQHSVSFSTPNGSLAYATAFINEKPAAIPARRQRPTPVTAPLDRIAGNDRALGAIIKTCRKLLNTDIPLLLLGETGVGKDTMARAIHAESARVDKPYVAVNCAAIPPTLLASELFGYASGTFTGGAKGGKTGKIAASDGGTLFLDEIGDMPLDLQAYLLRVLEDHAVTPLGSTRDETVNLRLICATHRDLDERVSSGQFRKDLYYRIRGAQFTIPALRVRTDFAELVDFVLWEETRSDLDFGRGISPDALEVLRSYPWPGNIRELRNVIRLVVSLHGDERTIQIEHLPEYLPETSGKKRAKSAPARSEVVSQPCIVARDANGIEDQPACDSLRRRTSIAERHQIISALRSNLWNIAETANKLGVSRATLHRKIRLHGIAVSQHQLDT